MDQDVVRLHFPSNFAIESLPTKKTDQLKTDVRYTLAIETTPTSYTVRRDFTLASILFMPPDYPALRSFYSQMETKDQESVVLLRTSGDAAKPAGQ
jgi:hypothetical protein